MRMKDAFHFGDGIGGGGGFVTVANDQFGFRAADLAARVGNDAVAPRMRRTGIDLADNVVKGIPSLGRRAENHEKVFCVDRLAYLNQALRHLARNRGVHRRLHLHRFYHEQPVSL
jgi:hypothetical protein